MLRNVDIFGVPGSFGIHGILASLVIAGNPSIVGNQGIFDVFGSHGNLGTLGNLCNYVNFDILAMFAVLAILTVLASLYS